MGTAKRFRKAEGPDASKMPGPGQHDVPRVKLCKLSTKAADTPEIGFARSGRRQPAYIQVLFLLYQLTRIVVCHWFEFAWGNGCLWDSLSLTLAWA